MADCLKKLYLFFFIVKYDNLKNFFVTRTSSKKSVALTAVMAVVVLMAMGITDVFGDHQADFLVHEFGELLQGVEAEILKIPNDTGSSINTSDTMQTEMILSQIAFIEAFDEVIRSQIL